MPEIYNNENGKPGENGWRLVSVWDGQETTGDYTVGDELIAYYDAPGFPFTAELTFYVTGQMYDEADGWHEQVAGDTPVDGDIDLTRYGVDQRYEFFESPESRENGPDEEDYDGGSYLSHATLAAANAEARRMALNDIAWTFQDAVKIAEVTHA